MLSTIKKALSAPDDFQSQVNNVIRYEAKLGGQLFGPLPDNRRREFFCLDENTWVWHEEWQGDNGAWNTLTTRYEVRPHGVFKVQNGQYHSLSKQELHNFHDAVKLYGEKIGAALEQLANQL